MVEFLRFRYELRYRVSDHFPYVKPDTAFGTLEILPQRCRDLGYLLEGGDGMAISKTLHVFPAISFTKTN
jgi:hypothetical protein